MVPFACRSVLLTAPPASDPTSCRLRDRIEANPPVREAHLGTVVFLTHKKERAEAILDSEGRWHCPKLPVLDRVLNTLYEPGRDTRNTVPFGHSELIQVASWLKGVVVRIHRAPASIPPSEIR